jgi:hypothetical protein
VNVRRVSLRYALYNNLIILGREQQIGLLDKTEIYEVYRAFRCHNYIEASSHFRPQTLIDISGSHGGEHEEECFLGRCAV